MYQNARYFNSAYAAPACIMVEINGSPSAVPIDPANTDYSAIMKLVAAGKLIIAPAEGD